MFFVLFLLSLAFFKCVSEIWSYTLTFICPGWIQGRTAMNDELLFLVLTSILSQYYLESLTCSNRAFFWGLPSYLSAHKLSDWWVALTRRRNKQGLGIKSISMHHWRIYHLKTDLGCLSVVRGCDLIDNGWITQHPSSDSHSTVAKFCPPQTRAERTEEKHKKQIDLMQNTVRHEIF